MSPVSIRLAQDRAYTAEYFIPLRCPLVPTFPSAIGLGIRQAMRAAREAEWEEQVAGVEEGQAEPQDA